MDPGIVLSFNECTNAPECIGEALESLFHAEVHCSITFFCNDMILPRS